MTELIDVDELERRASSCLASGDGLIQPSAVIELIGRLRAAEKLIGQREVARVESGAEILAAFHKALPNAFEDIDAIVAEIDEGRGEADACSCDDSLALKTRVRELEERNASQARTIVVLDHVLADDPEFCSEPEAKLRMAKLKLGAWLTVDPYTRNALTVALGPNNFGTNLFIKQRPITLGYGANEADSILDALEREESERPARFDVERKLGKAKANG